MERREIADDKTDANRLKAEIADLDKQAEVMTELLMDPVITDGAK